MNEPVLCYVKQPWAFFTTQELSLQDGQCWDKLDYEFNSEYPFKPCWHNRPRYRNDPTIKREGYSVGDLCQCSRCILDWNPDGSPKWEITRLAFDAELYPPHHFSLLPKFSVKQINAGEISWLTGCGVEIFAGTPKDKFVEIIQQIGGTIYVPL